MYALTGPASDFDTLYRCEDKRMVFVRPNESVVEENEQKASEYIQLPSWRPSRQARELGRV